METKDPNLGPPVWAASSLLSEPYPKLEFLVSESCKLSSQAVHNPGSSWCSVPLFSPLGQDSVIRNPLLVPQHPWPCWRIIICVCVAEDGIQVCVCREEDGTQVCVCVCACVHVCV